MNIIRTTEGLKDLATFIYEQDNHGTWQNYWDSDGEGWPVVIDSWSEKPFHGWKRSYLKNARTIVETVGSYETATRLVSLIYSMKHVPMRTDTIDYFRGQKPSEQALEVWSALHQGMCLNHGHESCSAFYTPTPKVIQHGVALADEVSIAMAMLAIHNNVEDLKGVIYFTTQWWRMRARGL